MNALGVSEKRVQLNRAAEARRRAGIALDRLGHCELCAHRCGTNRLMGGQGKCHAGPRAHVFSAQTEVSDELLLIPTFAIALSGCDLRCSFCITGKESWNSHAGDVFDAESLAQQAVDAVKGGARTVMILGGEPTIYLPDVLELIALLPDDIELVWKTNGHATAQARELLEGMFNTWVVDYKFGNNACAERLSKTPNYESILRENLSWADQHTDLIVRHLIMPGHVACCWKAVAEWLAIHLPNVKVNLRGGFWPAWKSASYPELLGHSDLKSALAIAGNCKLRLVE